MRRLFGGIGRARSHRVRKPMRVPLESHPFILDCEDGAECAACGKYGHAKIHQEPHKLTREETEAFCEPV